LGSQPARIIINLGNSPSDPTNQHDSNVHVFQISCQVFFIHLPLQEDRQAAPMLAAASASHVSHIAVSGQ
jgi:hypothetical protein